MKNLSDIYSSTSLSVSYLMLRMSIWSIFLLTDITGIAITPALPVIHREFDNISRTEVEMLVSLPNMMLIPFVILSAHFVNSRHKIRTIQIGSLIFIVSAIAYQFIDNLHILLGISVLLGLGAGLIVPIATSLPGTIFYGKERQRQLGICSGVASISQVFCIVIAGWLATFDWHFPFIVYAIALVTLLLSPFLSFRNRKKIRRILGHGKPSKEPHRTFIEKGNVVQLMVLYFLLMFITMQIPLCLPFVLAKHHIDAAISGSMIALFFIVQALSSFFIGSFIIVFRRTTMAVVTFLIAVCLISIPFFKPLWLHFLFVAFAGVAGGVIEPLVWYKSSRMESRNKRPLVFGWIVASSYLAIWLSPYITDLISLIFDDYRTTFPMVIGGIVALLLSAYLLGSRNDRVLGMREEVHTYLDGTVFEE